MVKSLVVANWKMNGSVELIHRFHEAMTDLCCESLNIVLCAPNTLLGYVNGQHLPGHALYSLGAQNISSSSSGAYTGETSGSMLREMACKYVIIGHSERRALFNEASHDLVSKIEQALYADLTPILCVGESSLDRSQETHLDAITHQLSSVLNHIKNPEKNSIVIAYEPVWAIGTGNTASLHDIEEMHSFVKLHCKNKYGFTPKVLYGGSVNLSNAAEILASKSVDGGLIGGASLNPIDFKKLCQLINQVEINNV
jgi:triosephosphate isomerase